MKLPLLSLFRRVPFLLILLLAGGQIQAQNGIIGSGFSTGWTNPTNITYFSAGSGTSRILIKQANGTGNQYFRLVRGWAGNNTEYGPSGCVDTQLTPNNEYLNAPSCGSGAFYFNVSSTSDNYVFKTKDGATGTDFVHFRIQGPVRTVANASDVTRTAPSGTIYPGQAVTIQAVLNGTPSTGQGVYIRYTTNSWSSSAIAEMSFVSGNTYSVNIPSATNGASKTVEYYIFTSGAGKTIATTDASWYTINSQTNGGSNFSYSVAASWLSAANGNWNNTATWVGGVVPPSGQPVTILNTHTVTLNQAATASDVTINTGGTLIGSDGTTRVLTISANGTFTNNGTFTTTATGSLSFLGAATIGGSSTNTFADVSLNNGGVAFGNATITNGLTIFSGGFVASGSLSYGSAASLIYETGGAFTSTSNEWPSTNGPRTVRIKTTALSINHSRTISGNLRVDGAGQLLGPPAASTQTITFTGSPSVFQMDGILDPNPGASRNLNFVIASGTTYIHGSGGGASNPLFRFYNLTVDNGATLQAMPTSGTNCTFELQYGTLTNNGTIDLAPVGGSYANVTTRGTSGNTYDITGTGTTTFMGLIVGQTSTLTLHKDINVKSYLTVASPTASLVPVGNITARFTGASTYFTQNTGIDPNPSFGNTFSIYSNGYLTLQTAVEVFNVNIGAGGTIQMYDGATDCSLRSRSGATVQVDSGGTLKSGSMASSGGKVYSTNGNGTFTLMPGGHLVCRAPDGILSSGALGIVQMATRNFSSKATYTYEGSSAMTQGVFTTTPNDSTVRNLYVNISGGNALTMSRGVTVSYRLDLLQGSIALNGKPVIVDSILEMRANELTGSGSVLAKNFVRTQHAGGLSGTGSAIPTAPLTLTDNGTVEYYAATGTQVVTGRSDYGNLTMSAGTGATGQKALADSIVVRRNWTRTGADFLPATYRVTFGDSAQSTISATGGETFYRLTILKDTGRITLLSNVTASNSLKVKKGKVFTGANRVILGSAGHMEETVGAVDHYVVGTLEHTRSVGTGATTMGGAGLEMSAGSDLGNVTLTRFSGPTAAITGESPCCAGNTSINRRWRIEPQFQPSLANRYLSFRWPSEDDNNKDLTQFQLWKSPDGIQPFVRFDVVQDVSMTEPRVANGGPVVSFSEFTGTEDPTPLPVTWLSFSGAVKSDKAYLNWTTAQEVNALRFVVERSLDGRAYTQVGMVAAAGKANKNTDYSFTDAGFPGAAYYRLLQTDLDGTTAYSKIIYLRSGSTPTPKPLIFPNPLAKGNTLQYSSQEGGLHRVTLFSALGQQLATSPELPPSELSAWLGKQAATLPSGPYLIRAITPSDSFVLRWVKE